MTKGRLSNVSYDLGIDTETMTKDRKSNVSYDLGIDIEAEIDRMGPAGTCAS